MNENQIGDCSYCDQKETNVRGTPFLADVALGSRMCWRCWGIAEQASHGEIGRFYHSDMTLSISHELKEVEEQSPMQAIIENALKEMPEEMVYAMLAGVELVTDYDPDKGTMTIKTKHPIAVKKIGGRVTVYEKAKTD